MAKPRHCRPRLSDDNGDELPESIRQKLRDEYAEGPQRYAERWAKEAVRRGPTIGAHRRVKAER